MGLNDCGNENGNDGFGFEEMKMILNSGKWIWNGESITNQLIIGNGSEIEEYMKLWTEQDRSVDPVEAGKLERCSAKKWNRNGFTQLN